MLERIGLYFADLDLILLDWNTIYLIILDSIVLYWIWLAVRGLGWVVFDGIGLY